MTLSGIQPDEIEEGGTIGLPQGMWISLPWNHDHALLEGLDPHGKGVGYLYLPFHPTITASGRRWVGPESPDAYREEVDEVARHARRWDAGISLLANLSPWPVDVRALAKEAQRVAAQVPRVKVVFADISAARRARPHLEGIQIAVSCTANVFSPVQASYWRDLAGASLITMGREVNRRREILAAIKHLGVDIGVVAYDGCIPYCPFKSHHLSTSLGTDHSPDYCVLRFNCGCHGIPSQLWKEAPQLLASYTILPGHLSRYVGLVDEVKLPGRNLDTEHIIQSFHAYLGARSMEHPRGLYVEPEEAWEHIERCDRSCLDCDYCKDHLQFPPMEAEKAAMNTVEHDGGNAHPGEHRHVSAPEPGWRFTREQGPSVRIRCEPLGERPVIREVGGEAVAYNITEGVMHPDVVTLVHAVADYLQQCSHCADVSSGVGLPDGSWPAGFVLADQTGARAQSSTPSINAEPVEGN